MEVASRENATAQESMHDLEDLVKKIARSEKIDESREFACGHSGLAGEADSEAVQAGERPRRAQGAVCGADRRGHAVDPDRDFVPEQSRGRAAIEEAGPPAARRRRALPGRRELSAELEQHDRESLPKLASHARRESRLRQPQLIRPETSDSLLVSNEMLMDATTNSYFSSFRSADCRLLVRQAPRVGLLPEKLVKLGSLTAKF